MISVLGMRRVLFLLLLAGLNGLLGAIVYGYLEPQERLAEQDVRIVRGQIFDLQSDIEKMSIEYEQLEKQQGQFEILAQSGFFEFQGRRKAQELFENIQRRANVIKAVANIDAGRLDENNLAGKADHDLLVSPVTLEIESYDDIDVYKYLYLLKQSFPGHIALDKLDLRRVADMDAVVLRGIAGGDDISLVSAEIELTWRTMVPRNENEDEQEEGR